MKKPILEITEIKKIGFQYLSKENLEDGDYYKWWVFYKNDSEIHITYEYNQKGEFQKGYVEFNGETLKGRELTKKDVEFLIEIM